MNLKEKYENIVNEYIKTFEKKFDVSFDGWVGDEIGGINCVADMFLNFDDIRFVIDNELTFEDLYSWYWFNVENGEFLVNLKKYMRLKTDFMQINSYFKENFNYNHFHYWLTFDILEK